MLWGFYLVEKLSDWVCGTTTESKHTCMQSSSAKPISIATANKLIKCQSNWFSLQVQTERAWICVSGHFEESQIRMLKRSGWDICCYMLRKSQMCSAVACIMCVLLNACVSLYDIDTQREEVRHLSHLILNIQRTVLFMEEFQGLHMAVSRCVVDSIGSTLKV